jgi:uncharacterized repeat protein (TIGR01451 family)
MLVMLAAFGRADASARPSVLLKLEGDVVQHDSKGAEVLVPLASGQGLTPGQTIRYLIVATNAGTQAANHLVPQAKIPAGTAYEPGTASNATDSRVEFSLDGGRTWSAKPLVKVPTANGSVEKPADPALYTAVRFARDTPLAPKTSVTYSYEVRIK